MRSLPNLLPFPSFVHVCKYFSSKFNKIISSLIFCPFIYSMHDIAKNNFNGAIYSLHNKHFVFLFNIFSRCKCLFYLQYFTALCLNLDSNIRQNNLEQVSTCSNLPKNRIIMCNLPYIMHVFMLRQGRT